MKLSLAECQSQYHQLNKARLKQETKPVYAVLQMQTISEEYCLKGMVLLLAEQLVTKTGQQFLKEKEQRYSLHCTEH